MSFEFSVSSIKACCILHNYVRGHDRICFEDTFYDFPLVRIPTLGVKSNTQGVAIKEHFGNYFISPQ